MGSKPPIFMTLSAASEDVVARASKEPAIHADRVNVENAFMNPPTLTAL
jgi:hypothetical protein